MPGQAAFRTFVGVAKDTSNAWLQIAHNSGATTLTLRTITPAGTLLTVSGATVSAVIVDGPLTETVACSGNLSATTDGSTIACGALANTHTANCYVYFQVTASIGPTAYLPITKPAAFDDYKQIYSQSYIGSNVKNFAVNQGMRMGSLQFDGEVFADTFGYLLSSFMGSYDYTATSGGNPTTYAMAVNNATNAQPTPYLFYIYNPGASNFRVFARSVVTDLTIKADPGALLSYTTSITSFASGVVANPGTIPPAYSAFKVVPSRVASATIGGTITPKVETYEIALKRDQAGPITTLQGNQDPLTIFVGPASATCKTSLVIDDDVQLLNYINGSIPSFLLTATQGTGTAANGLTIQTSKANYEQVKPIYSGKGWVTLEVPFTAIANSTDKSTAGGGLSPALITLSTGTTTGATLY